MNFAELLPAIFQLVRKLVHSLGGKNEGEGEPSQMRMAAPKLAKLKNKPLWLKIKELYIRNGFEWDDEINIFGVRDETGIKRDIWNDVIGVVVGNGEVRLYKGTCDPCIYWVSNRNRKKHGWNRGCAHLCLGQHKNAYVIGTHRGYQAIVQWGAKVKIWRDMDADFEHDIEEKVQAGFYGINIHKGKGITIGRDSAGCQVIRSPSTFADLLEFVKSSTKYIKNRKCRFSYTLFEKGQVSLFTELKRKAK